MAKARQSARAARRKRPSPRPTGAPRQPSREAPTFSTPRPATSATAPARPPTARASASAKAPDLAAEYRYVLTDLRRLGILAAASFATLMLLALLIR